MTFTRPALQTKRTTVNCLSPEMVQLSPNNTIISDCTHEVAFKLTTNTDTPEVAFEFSKFSEKMIWEKVDMVNRPKVKTSRVFMGVVLRKCTSFYLCKFFLK